MVETYVAGAVATWRESKRAEGEAQAKKVPDHIFKTLPAKLQKDVLAGRAELHVGVTLTDMKVVAELPAGHASNGLGITSPLSTGNLHIESIFKYPPIKKGQIRLLSIITPGLYPICKLESFDVDQAPAYAAMSYAWGSPVVTRAIFCKNPDDDPASLSVSEHVLEALNSLFEYVNHSYRIWIDALCIDQANAEEKAHQIATMPKIYSQAQKVLCWLGAAADNSDFALDEITDLTETMDRVRMAQGKRLAQDPAQDEEATPINLHYDAWLAAYNIFGRPWFHRLWVVQEALMARDLVLVCGDRTVSWESLQTLATSILRMPIEEDLAETALQRFGMTGFEMLGDWRLEAGGALLQGLSSPEFVKLLQYGSRKQVKEPVDRIWALIGLARPELRAAVTPLIDYSDSARNSYHLSFLNFAAAFLRQDSRLHLLSLSTLTPQDPRLPTWCPTFAPWLTTVLPSMLQDPGSGTFNAGFSDEQPLAVDISFSRDNNHLLLRGFVLGRIQQVKSFNTSSPEALLASDLECLRIAESVYGMAGEAAHACTLIADNRQWPGVDDDEPLSPDDIVSMYETWGWCLESNLETDSLPVETRGALVLYLDRRVTGRTYVEVGGGPGIAFNRYIGLAPMHAAVGDYVCIVYGAEMPFILRPKGVSGSKMQFIGDAYIHGAMRGAALYSPMRMATEQVFTIV